MKALSPYPGLTTQPDAGGRHSLVRRVVQQFLRSQFGRPTGFWGGLAGRIMARTRSNHERAKWTISLLGIKPRDRILEIGFGPGIAIELASRLAGDGRVVGIDHSEVMLRQATRRNAAAVRERRVELHLGSVAELPGFDEPFDKVFTINSIHFWEEPLQRLKELRRVLKPGGLIAVTLQPRSRNATGATTAAIGDELAARLRSAGFMNVTVDVKQTESVPVACVRGINLSRAQGYGARGETEIEGTMTAVTPDSSPSYVLITPAKDEAAFIEQTLKSVISQTVLPLKWVIVSDGSTDGTDDIVRRYAAQHEWIELVTMPERNERHFAGKVGAFNAGYARIAGLTYDVVGNLDADISVDPHYFAFLLDKFKVMPDLGVVGTPFVEEGFKYNYNFVNIDHVSGACQLFRAKCFQDIGGYKPIKGGGIDWVAVTTARMLGWRTRTFTEKTCLHHRLTGTGKDGLLKARFKVGQKDYFLGGHPLWEIFRAVYQMTLRPYVIGGLFILGGYLWASLNRHERRIPPELMHFRRREQMQQFRRILRRGLRPLEGKMSPDSLPAVRR